MVNPAHRKVDVYFETRMSPLFNKHKEFVQENNGITARMGRVFADTFLWIKSHFGSEKQRATRIVKLIESEGKISLFEKLQWKRAQGDTTVFMKLEAGDSFYKQGCSKFIEEALSFMDLEDENRVSYHRGMQDMIGLANSLQESDVKTKALNTNRVFCAHNRLRIAEENKYISSSNVESFEKAIQEDMKEFASVVKQLRQDVRNYRTLKSSFERPALGEKIATDVRSLVRAYEKLVSNSAFTEYGWDIIL